MPYVTVPELLKRKDKRDIAALVADDGVAVGDEALVTDVNLLACMDDASGEIDAALLYGGRYTSAQLTGLTGNARAWLWRITSDLTMYWLLDRRPRYDKDMLEAHQLLRDRHLERIRKGENIFNLADESTVEASVVQLDAPSIQVYEGLDLVRDHVRNYYPARRIPRR